MCVISKGVIMEYEIIFGKDILVVQDVINCRLNNGWALQGGISEGKEYYMQAIVKKKDE